MKYIFLDIDGVLARNEQQYIDTQLFWKSNQWAKELKVLYPFDKECVDNFNDIVYKTGASIILSSDWKLFWELDELETIFRNNGIEYFPIGVTENFMVSGDSWMGLEKNRASQLAEYINRNEIINYVILDDLDVRLYMDPIHRDKCFILNPDTGIKDTSIKNDIIAKLNSFYDEIN